jgi:hypothetical protein
MSSAQQNCALGVLSSPTQILGACAYRSLEGMWHLFPVAGALEIPLRGRKENRSTSLARSSRTASRSSRRTKSTFRGARTVRLTSPDGNLYVDAVAGTFHQRLAETIARVFRLDEDLSGFYALVAEDDLAWCATGAGRMLRAPTVFEDVVKTI